MCGTAVIEKCGVLLLAKGNATPHEHWQNRQSISQILQLVISGTTPEATAALTRICDIHCLLE